MARVAIAGASGFVGTALRRALLDRGHAVVGLTRSDRAGSSERRSAGDEHTGRRTSDDEAEWRRCDLYSLLDAERGLEGCDYAIYLVHSMMPSARLTQASFEDLDFILADNFGRAAASAGVKQIIYLGGLIPDVPKLSQHLQSRLEVERTLGSHGVPVTALRAGLVVGPGGSSLEILTKLVRRLPAMLTPKWTLSDTQPIALQDVVRAVLHVLGKPDEFRGAFDVGGPDVMSYRQMMKRTAAAMGVKRPMAPVPLFTPSLSTLWVSLVTGASTELVGPLVHSLALQDCRRGSPSLDADAKRSDSEGGPRGLGPMGGGFGENLPERSLRHSMVVHDNPLQRWLAPEAIGFDESVRRALSDARRDEKPRVRRKKPTVRTVRSVQRLPRPEGVSARWVAEEYIRWLPNIPLPGIRCVTQGRIARFYVAFRFPLLIMRLSNQRQRAGRALFYIEGGALVDTSGPRPGRFEFRLTADGQHVVAAIHEFRPRLPWALYVCTQAIAHLWVMRAFGRHLARITRSDVVASAAD